MDEISADPRLTSHHPRLRHVLYGQDDAEHRLLSAYTSGRFHHAWLLTGQPGIGKATLAYRFARFVLANPQPDLITQNDLSVDPTNPVARRIESRGHSDLLTIEPVFDEKTKRLKTLIDAAHARRAGQFYARTAGEGGWRVCIIDAADDMNAQAANSVLKILEEPPPRSLFLLISHSPGRLLATIRSRCIPLSLAPLDTGTIAKIVAEVSRQSNIDQRIISEFAAGSAGRALQLIQSGASAKFFEFQKIAGKGAPFDRKSIWSMCDHLAQRKNDEDYQLFCDLLQQWLMTRAVATAQSGPGNTLAPRLADQSRDLSHSIRRANALNLDRREVILDAIESIESIERAVHTN